MYGVSISQLAQHDGEQSASIVALKTAQTVLEASQAAAEADITEIQTGQATLEAQDTAIQDTAISEQISALETA